MVTEALLGKRQNAFIFILTILDRELNSTIISIFSIKATTKTPRQTPDKVLLASSPGTDFADPPG
jgi:hypothetical protein